MEEEDKHEPEVKIGPETEEEIGPGNSMTDEIGEELDSAKTEIELPVEEGETVGGGGNVEVGSKDGPGLDIGDDSGDEMAEFEHLVSML